MSDKPHPKSLKLTLKRKATESVDSVLVSGVSVVSSEPASKIKKIKIKSVELWDVPKQEMIKVISKLLFALLEVKDTLDENRRLIEFFIELVSREDYPDYYLMIAVPVSILSIQKKMEAGEYQTMEEFKQDVLLMFTNCCKYNQPESGIYLDAKTLEATFLTSFQLLRDDHTGKSKLNSRNPLASDEMPDIVTIIDSLKTPPIPLEQQILDAIRVNDSALVEALLDPEAVKNINSLWSTFQINEEFTWSYLHAASFFGTVKIMQTLIDKGANVELEDTLYHGRPLAWASFGGQTKAVRLLLERYSVDKSAKNVHGQVAWDLVDQKHVAQWRGMFAERKAAVVSSTPGSLKVPSKAASYATLPRRPPTTYGTPATARLTTPGLAKSASTDRLYPRNSLGAPFTPGGYAASSQQTPTARQAQAQAGQTQQVSLSGDSHAMNNYGQIVPKISLSTPYAAYKLQNRELQQESSLITSLLVASNDDLFTLLIPARKSDPEWGFFGNFISLPNGCKTINLRYVLDDEPFKEDSDAPNVRYSVTGFQSINYPIRTASNSVTTMAKTEALIVKASGTFGEIIEIPIVLQDGLNSIEVCVTATAWGEGEAVYGLHQTQCLILNKS